MIADNREHFLNAWNEHINDLTQLKHSLDVDEWDELEEIQKRLADLVEDAAANVDE